MIMKMKDLIVKNGKYLLLDSQNSIL